MKFGEQVVKAHLPTQQASTPLITLSGFRIRKQNSLKRWESILRHFLTLLRDAPLYIWVVGGSRVFVACKLFFYLRKKTIFFCDQRPTIFFLCCVEEIFCRMLPLICTLPLGVFSGQHIFHQFRQQTFFFCPHFQQTFFLTFVATNYFFQFFSTPPPQILNGASLSLSRFASHILVWRWFHFNNNTPHSDEKLNYLVGTHVYEQNRAKTVL